MTCFLGIGLDITGDMVNRTSWRYVANTAADCDPSSGHQAS